MHIVMRRWRDKMRWLKVVGLRFHSLEKRERRRDQDRIRRYSKWRGDRYRWMRIVNIMDVWGKRQEHVEGQGEGDGGKHEEREGNGATGTVNVGTGAATINIGSTAASAIVIGNTAGTVTLRCPITLGPEPTTDGQLGFITAATIPSAVVPSGSAQVSLLITIPGIYLASYTLLLSGSPTSFQTRFQSGGAQNGFVGGALTLNSTNLSSSQTQIVSSPTNSTLQIIIQYTGGSGLSMGGVFRIVRLA